MYESNSTLNNCDLMNIDENGGGLLSSSYAVDLYENFDSESEFSDPLNPFDLDTMMNKVCARLSLGTKAGSTSPIVSSLHLKQQEHQRNHILIPKLFDFLILLSHEKKTSNPSMNVLLGAGSKKSSYKTGKKKFVLFFVSAIKVQFF